MRPVVLALAALATLAMVLRQKLNGHVSLLTLPEASGSAVVSAELGRMDWQHPVGHTLAGPTLRSTTHCCEGSDEGGTS